MFVPVVNLDNKPLMPTKPSRARRWILSKRATPFWKKGIFCIRLNEKTKEEKQEIACGIDPGSKKEGFTVKSKSHTYLNNSFEAHCLDSWVLANSIVDAHTKPDNTEVLLIKPIQFYRRQLHRLQPSKAGTRKSYGGTISLGLKRGSLIKHPKLGITYVGGSSKGKISLHSVEAGVRLTQNAKVEDCKFLTFNRRRTFIPRP